MRIYQIRCGDDEAVDRLLDFVDLECSGDFDISASANVGSLIVTIKVDEKVD